MSLEDLGNIGEFVAAVAVVVSLIYLAVQIRQNTKTTRVQIFQQLSLHSAEELQATGRNPHATRLFVAGLPGRDNLSEEEQGQFDFLIMGIFTFFENLHYQYLSGMLEEELWQRYRRHIQWYLDRDGVRQWWSLTESTWMSDSFRRFVNEQLAGSKPIARS
jgi:hypothetical protein